MSPVSPFVVAFSTGPFVLLGVAVGGWVALDARSRGSDHPLFWGVFAPLSGVLLLYYVLWVRRQHDREQPRSRWERYAAVVAVAGLGGLVVAAVVLPPDPVSQMLFWPVAFAGCLPVAYWVLIARGESAGRTPS